jgi:hypothetical protein
MLGGMGGMDGIGPMKGPEQTNPMGIDPSNKKDFEKQIHKPFKGQMDGIEKGIYEALKHSTNGSDNDIKKTARMIANSVKMLMHQQLKKAAKIKHDDGQ